MKAFGEAGVYRAVDLDDFDSQVEQVNITTYAVYERVKIQWAYGASLTE